MAISVKYNSGGQLSESLKIGNFYLGVGDVGKGPTSSTGYYHGITPPTNGYTIYINKVSGGPSIYVANNDTQLISLVNQIELQSFTTVTQCLAYYATLSDRFIINNEPGPLVTDGLILNLDAGFTPSYPRSGTTWYDVSPSGNNGTLTNSPTFNSNDGGSIVFDGVDDYIQLNQTITLTGEFTLNLFILPTATNAKVLLGNNGADYLQINNASALGLFSSAQSITLNGYSWDVSKPSMVTVTRNSSNIIQTYKNSVSSVTGSLTGDFRIRQIGQRGDLSRFYQGSIYIIQVYNRALSEYEIYQNYITALNPNMVTDGKSLIQNWNSLSNLTSRTPNALIAPDGTRSATLFERISIDKPGHGQIRQQFPVIDLLPSTSYDVSFWAKRVNLTQRIDFEFSDTPQQIITLTDDWKFYSFSLTTNATFPVGKFIDIGSTTVSAGSVLNEQYSIWNLHVSISKT